MIAEDTQPPLCLQPPLCFAQWPLLDSYNVGCIFPAMPSGEKIRPAFGSRLKTAMTLGGYRTDKAMAKALTEFIQKYVDPEKDIPEQTIQSARTKEKKSLFEYTLHCAYLCKVNPFWLAFNLGTAREPGKDGDSWPFVAHGEQDNPSQIEKLRKLKAEVDGMLADAESKEKPERKSKGRRAVA